MGVVFLGIFLYVEGVPTGWWDVSRDWDLSRVEKSRLQLPQVRQPGEIVLKHVRCRNDQR